MPRATVTTDTQKFDLKSCPGGFVELKSMTYGQWLHRQEMAMRLRVQTQGKEFGGEMAMANKSVTLYEFQQCIVNHNLEDENGGELDFRNATTLETLNPRIGNEIGSLIMQLHEPDESLGNESAPALF